MISDACDQTRLSAMFDELFKPAALPQVERPSQIRVAMKSNHLARVPTPMHSGLKSQTKIDIQCICDEYRACFVQINHSNMTNVQTMRLIYNAGNGAWLVGFVDELIIILFQTNHVPEMLIRWAMNSAPYLGINITLSPTYEEPLSSAAVSSVIAWSFIFELNRAHGWIQIGKEGNVMSISDIISKPLVRGEKQHRNVPVMIFEPLHDCLGFSVEVKVFKYYPLNVDEVLSPGHSSLEYPVFTLPNLSEAVCITSHLSEKKPSMSTVDIVKHWETYHGYRLTPAVASATLKVRIHSNGSELIYPTVCLWRHCWTYIPAYTNEYTGVMLRRLEAEFSLVISSWRAHGGVHVRSSFGAEILPANSYERLEDKGSKTVRRNKRKLN
jgi:hypothetical protein